MKYKIEVVNWGYRDKYNVYKKPWYSLFYVHIGMFYTKEQALSFIARCKEVLP